MKFQLVSQMIEKNGKTVRENNLEKLHKFPIGTLVEYNTEDKETEFEGIRLYVTHHTRDCDGSPLYSLGSKDGYASEYGFDEDGLKEVPNK